MGTPTLVPPGAPVFMPVVERAIPGLIIVNSKGERYINESVLYHKFVDKMYEKNSEEAFTIPSWMILDEWAKKRYLIFGIVPFQAFPKEWEEAGYLKKADTSTELVQK